MGREQGRAIGGSLLGGLLGGVLGLGFGGFLGPVLAGVERHPDESVLNVFDACLGFVFTLVGASIGGVVGAVGGAAIGAGMATGQSSTDGRQVLETREESVDSELQRLRSRIAELEEQQQPAAQPDEPLEDYS